MPIIGTLGQRRVCAVEQCDAQKRRGYGIAQLTEQPRALGVVRAVSAQNYAPHVVVSLERLTSRAQDGFCALPRAKDGKDFQRYKNVC